MKEEIIWRYPDEELPVIPEGMFGVSVLLTTYDCYEEEQEGNGYTVTQYSYMMTKREDGSPISKYYEDSPLEADFMSQIVSYRNQKLESMDFGPLSDEIIAWAYLPAPAKRKA